LIFFINILFFIRSGYDAAVYSAASSYYQQQQTAKAMGSWAAKKPGAQPFKVKPKGPPKTPQLHYCDVCKISCAGPQVWFISSFYFIVICHFLPQLFLKLVQ